MCGIIAITSKDHTINVAKMITEGLKRLEYRGYDSVGVATIDNNGEVHLRKDQGSVNRVVERLNLTQLKGSTGIGHTRWATHGPPIKENAHPHSDCTGKIAIAHNGIVENYIELKKELEEKGHTFKSETDTEVIAHLVEEEFKKTKSLTEAFRNSIKQLEGTYAITMISVHEPNKVFLCRKASPLVIGLRNNMNFAASDIPAFLEYTKKVIFLKDGEIAIMTPNDVFIEHNGIKIVPRAVTVSWTTKSAQKSGYPHFMLKEIYEQPIALKNTLNLDESQLNQAANTILDSKKLLFIACGTSYYAGLSGYHRIHKMLDIPVYHTVGSDYDNYKHIIDESTTILAISQSGETLDVMRPLSHALSQNAKTIALTNVLDSSIPRLSKIKLYTRAGPEIGVAATKTHTSQIALLSALGLNIKKQLGHLSEQEYNRELESYKEGITQVTRKVINKNELKAKRLASIIKTKNSAYYLARGINLPIAKEGSLKMKEISYIHAEAYSAGESKHGPIALVEKDYPVIYIAPGNDNIQENRKILGNAEEMRARGAYNIAVTSKDHVILNKSDFNFIIPEESTSLMTPITYIVPLQMLAYYTSVARGYNPDKPRNLAKTVTVE